MMIRGARPEDERALVELAVRFTNESQYGRLMGPAQPARVVELIRVLPAVGGVVSVVEVAGQVRGFLALAALEHPVSGGRYADELAWYVEPESRGGTLGPKLLRAGEEWARHVGCGWVKMVAPYGTDVGRFLARKGYEPVEVAWVLRL